MRRRAKARRVMRRENVKKARPAPKMTLLRLLRGGSEESSAAWGFCKSGGGCVDVDLAWGAGSSSIRCGSCVGVVGFAALEDFENMDVNHDMVSRVATQAMSTGPESAPRISLKSLTGKNRTLILVQGREHAVTSRGLSGRNFLCCYPKFGGESALNYASRLRNAFNHWHDRGSRRR
jgi:hypothetical protein